MRKQALKKMSIFSKIFNQAKTASLSPEEKKLDSILKQAANDAFVKLIPTDKKNIYDVDVTLENGKSILSYGVFQWSYDVGEEPNVDVFFKSDVFEDDLQMIKASDTIGEWGRKKYGEQYRFICFRLSTKQIQVNLLDNNIPFDPEEHEEFDYEEIKKKGGSQEAEKRFCEFISKKLSAHTTILTKSIEYSINNCQGWPCKKEEHDRNNEVANKVTQGTRAAAGMLSSAFDMVSKKMSYSRTMKNILTECAKQMGWELTPQSDKNFFNLCQFEEGTFFLKHSTDVNNPTVDVEFISFPFVGDGKAERVGNAIANSRFGNVVDIYTVSKIQLKLKKSIALQNIEDEADSIMRVKYCVQSLINTVDSIQKNIQKWPTKSETEALIRELEAEAAAEEWARKARVAADQQAAEAEQRKQMIAKCKLNIGKLRAKVAECEADCTSHRGDDYYRRRRDSAKADLAKEKYKLQQLEAGEDLRFIHVY